MCVFRQNEYKINNYVSDKSFLSLKIHIHSNAFIAVTLNSQKFKYIIVFISIHMVNISETIYSYLRPYFNRMLLIMSLMWLSNFFVVFFSSTKMRASKCSCSFRLSQLTYIEMSRSCVYSYSYSLIYSGGYMHSLIVWPLTAVNFVGYYHAKFTLHKMDQL